MESFAVDHILDQTLDLAYGLAFQLCFSDRRAQKIISEALDLLKVRGMLQAPESREQAFELKRNFLQCVHRCFLASRDSQREHGENSERSQLLQRLEPMLRGMLFLKHRADFQYDDLAIVFERDRHVVMNEVGLAREFLLEHLHVH